MAAFTISPLLINVLRCPIHPSAGKLQVVSGDGPADGSGISAISLVCPSCRREYPIHDGIPDMLVSDPGTHSFREEEMAQWDGQASAYEQERVKDQVYMAGIEGAAAALAPQNHDVVLDAGCGTGLTIKQYIRPSIQVVAFDLSMDSLRCLRRSVNSPSLLFVKGDVTALPFASAAFDKVLCANTINQLPQAHLRTRCLRELSRVSRLGGRVVISAQNFSIPKKRAGWRKQGTAKASSGPVQYIYRFDPAEFQDLLRSTMQVDSLFGAGLPLPYRFKLSRLSRLAEKALRRFRLSSYWGNMIVGACRKGENLLVTQDD